MSKLNVADAVSEERLWARHVEMARIGGTPKGGVKRLALTPEDIEARRLLVRWARELGFGCAADPIGNMFFRREGTDAGVAPVMSGSHTDTQVTGGRFDGIYGVLAAFEALQAAEDAGITTKRPMEAVVWTHEEGSRFPPGCMGSQVFADPAKLDQTLALTDLDGITVAAALAEFQAALPDLERRPFECPVDAFIEAHIEQGPVLEATGKTIGIVTGIQGTRRFTIEVEGEEAHAGTTPRAHRKDAVLAAVDMIAALRRLMHDDEDKARFTVGRFIVSPNGTSVVPAHVLFTIDFRHPDDEALARLGDQIKPVCADNAGPCQVTVSETRRVPTHWFPDLVPDAILAAAQRLEIPHMHIFSGAGHDARYLLARCPSGMIFVPCEKGISHTEAENAKPEDLAAGAKVLAEAMVALANR
ncbi:MAG: Zn-dependent hydrolase [Hyphomicrobiaceae bacterium]|nr:Zn-dependent hydrolase [Hyphomicrobiaceae bacterium]